MRNVSGDDYDGSELTAELVALTGPETAKGALSRSANRTSRQ
jgi:hypothetical protein